MLAIPPVLLTINRKSECNNRRKQVFAHGKPVFRVQLSSSAPLENDPGAECPPDTPVSSPETFF